MLTSRAKVLPSSRLTLKDRLSRLTFEEAVKFLGPEGRRLIQKNANKWEFSLPDDVHLSADLFRLRFPSDDLDSKPVHVTITLLAEARDRLHFRCDACGTACDHAGATFAFILEEKLALGLSAAPPEPNVDLELDDEELTRRAIEERFARARSERMTLQSSDPSKPWTDYIVTNRLSGKSYRVALRGTEPGDSYCSCPDFRSNTLGTCKHILSALVKVKRRFPATRLARRFRPTGLALHLAYGRDVTLRLQAPDKLERPAEKLIGDFRDRPIEDIPELLKRLAALQKLGQEVTVYPDAEEFIEQRMTGARLRSIADGIRRDPGKHPLRKGLLRVPLLPFQVDGIAFAVGAGRAILADDMGLGKTIQGVGVAELLAREVDIRRVLVICPASLKAQWRSEIRRFCGREVQLVAGPANERHQQYENDCFFTVCNYEQVLRDILPIERAKWDLIILDEGQRIKNWESKTSQVVKSLRSRFALVLTGTPLENRLDDLYSIVQFVDDRRLGPGFRFFHQHRILDEKGRVLGYKNLAQLRETLKPILLRRTRESVRLELPERTTEFIRIPPSDEQAELHRTHMQIVVAIAGKRFLTEMDLMRLRAELLVCRMAADSSFLVNRQTPAHSTKLERLDELFESLFEEEDRKVVLFSEWTTMLDLIEPLLKKRRLGFVRLDGGVPQKHRNALVERFQTDENCRLFLTTNAGSTGLNLQAANTIINVDLPWNPAVLEQRIARAHRMGQKRPVQVYVLVTEGTIEDNLLTTLAAKKDLALAALDVNSDVDSIDIHSGIEEMRARLEILLGARREAPLDESVRARAEESARQLGERRQRVAAAGGEFVDAAIKFLGALTNPSSNGQAGSPSTVTLVPAANVVDSLRQGLEACTEVDQSGRARFSVALPDKGALDQLAQLLARFLASAGELGKRTDVAH